MVGIFVYTWIFFNFKVSGSERVINYRIRKFDQTPLWLEFSLTLEKYFRYGFWVANISNVGKNIFKNEICLTVQILRFRHEMLSLPNSIRI